MTVEELYRFLQFLLKKESTGHISPDDYNNMLPRSQEEYFNWAYGLPNSYQPGRPIPPIAYEMTQKIKDDLRRCKVRMDGKDFPRMVVDADGRGTLPADYVHVTAINYLYSITSCKKPAIKHRPVEIFDDDKFTERRSHPTKHPTKYYPICNFFNTYIQFDPIDLGSVEFVYLRYPKKPHRDYVLDANNDQDIYVASGGLSGSLSQEIELPEDTHYQIARIILSYYGINLREQDLLAYAEQKKLVGV